LLFFLVFRTILRQKGVLIVAALAASKLDAPLVTTRNALTDVIGWLADGAYVVIHAAGARFFHKCEAGVRSDAEVRAFLENHRVIYVDASSMPELLENGAWNWLIKDAGYDECACSLKGRVSDPRGILHAARVALIERS
jgi:hypothetical protein